MNDSITKKQLLGIIANHIGVESGEISQEDRLNEDLHLNPSGLADLSKTLEENGLDIDKLNFLEIETIEDIFEALEIE